MAHDTTNYNIKAETAWHGVDYPPITCWECGVTEMPFIAEICKECLEKDTIKRGWE